MDYKVEYGLMVYDADYDEDRFESAPPQLFEAENLDDLLRIANQYICGYVGQNHRMVLGTPSGIIDGFVERVLDNKGVILYEDKREF